MAEIVDHSTPVDMDEYTTDAPVAKSEKLVMYGPYNEIKPSTTYAFVSRKQQRITVHYKEEYPVLEVNLKRRAEISHWGDNLNIQDDMVLHNAGPK